MIWTWVARMSLGCLCVAALCRAFPRGAPQAVVYLFVELPGFVLSSLGVGWPIAEAGGGGAWLTWFGMVGIYGGLAGAAALVGRSGGRRSQRRSDLGGPVTDSQLLICVATDGAEDLQVEKVYRRLPDDHAEGHGMVRVVDDSGEDYLYPAALFRNAPSLSA